MTNWKEEIVSALVAESEEKKIFAFRPIAERFGYKQIKSADVREIVSAFCGRVPSYRPYVEASKPRTALFNDLFFASEEVIFEEMEA